MLNLGLVIVGGGIGAGIRHLLNMGAMRLLGSGYPWGTMIINITGSFAMGAFIELLARRFGASNELRLFVATGILGGYTTFSSFSLDFAALWERGALGPALAYVLVSVVGGILALFAAFWLVRNLV
ncbi:fluoride efflux transporter CrcB [Mesorhizobium sp. 8]|jgi:CrcB protein|uniref:fluoride efflux transporter CrcB n=1 Tax=Mesorhizobium sp. 8 TaxID=2584466 RepID=UPI00111FBF3F|nr:fluoride efflux transporter CrcB [Mesorhizobium sp. 8]QDB99181.1 fluoride efflux transporter CrcB [Mesorhizobium sp. 8]